MLITVLLMIQRIEKLYKVTKINQTKLNKTEIKTYLQESRNCFCVRVGLVCLHGGRRAPFLNSEKERLWRGLRNGSTTIVGTLAEK